MTILIIMNGNSIMIIFRRMVLTILVPAMLCHFLMCVDSCEHIDYLMLHFHRHFLRYLHEEAGVIYLYLCFFIIDYF
jgi:hypothetical protein